MNPGKNGKTFTIYLEDTFFKKGDILTSEESTNLKVIKVYKFNLWRKLLYKLGFNIKIFNGVKVKTIDEYINRERLENNETTSIS